MELDEDDKLGDRNEEVAVVRVEEVQVMGAMWIVRAEGLEDVENDDLDDDRGMARGVETSVKARSSDSIVVGDDGGAERGTTETEMKWLMRDLKSI